MHSRYLRAPRKECPSPLPQSVNGCQGGKHGPLYGSVQSETVFTIFIYKSPSPHRAEMASPVLCVQHTEPLLSRQRAWPADWSHHGHFSRRVLSQRFLKLQPKGCWRAAPEVEQINPRYTWVTMDSRAQTLLVFQWLALGVCIMGMERRIPHYFHYYVQFKKYINFINGRFFKKNTKNIDFRIIYWRRL